MFSIKKIILIVLFLPIIAYTLFEIIYFNAAYPNVSLGNLDVGGKNKSELKKLIEEELNNRQYRTLSFDINKTKPIAITLNENLLSYDIDKTVEKVVTYGKKGTLQQQWQQKLNLAAGVNIEPEYEFDELTFDTILADNLRPFENEVIETKIINEDGQLALSPSKPGYLADRTEIMAQVKDFINLRSNQVIYKVNFKVIPPKATRENSKEALAVAQKLSTKQIQLYSAQLPDKTWTIDSDTLYDFLEFKYDEEKQKPVVSLASYKVASYSAELSSFVYKEPKEGKIQTDGEKTTIIEQAEQGQALDVEKLTDEINKNAFTGSFITKIEIPIKTLTPAITQITVAKTGVKEVIASGQSRFVGSSPGRIHNIAIATEKLNGAIIKPNETFSLHKTIGDIEKSTGYQDSAIIKNGRTITGIGGGVCQVSTTLFRAALAAGLPITERAPHSYRVSYYEQDSPPGFDAAIYFPIQDLKFKNTLPGNIVVQATMDKDNSLLTVNLFGDTDGRLVDVYQPEISNEKPAPPELRINDPTLLKGHIRQTEFEAKGATITVKRKVTKNGKSILEDTIKSVYRPWQSVIYVGTKEN